MEWADALKEVRVVESAGAGGKIAGVEYDSRRVGAGAAFVAMRGGTTDGNRYIGAAIAQGAAAIVTDSHEAYAKLRHEHPGMPTALVEHGRRALAELSAAVLGHPERKLALSAVTGTNGKTTTAYLLEQMLRSAGRGTVMIGTIETHVGDEVRASPHTTPESRDTLQVFADGVRAGATEAVMEMSSHALDQERVWGMPVDVAIFTNLTQDHLDYHGTMERMRSKARLFEGVGAAAAARRRAECATILWGNRMPGWRGTRSECRTARNGGASSARSGSSLRAGETSFRFVTTPGRS